MKTLRVWLVQGDTVNGDSRDLFVSARGPVEAMKLWRKCYELENDAAPEYVFAVPDKATHPHAHAWINFNNYAGMKPGQRLRGKKP